MAKKKTSSVIVKAGKPAATKAPVAPTPPRMPDTPVPQKVKRGQVVDERAIVRASAAPRWANRKPR